MWEPKNIALCCVMILGMHNPVVCMSDESVSLPADKLVHEIINETGLCEKIRLDQLETVIKHYPYAVHAVDKNGRPALHVAVKNGCLKIVSFLVEHGADHTKIDKWGKSAIAYTDSKDTHGIRQYLELVDAFYQTPNNSDSFDTFAEKHLTSQKAFVTVKKLLPLAKKGVLKKKFSKYLEAWLQEKREELFELLQDNTSEEKEKIQDLTKLVSIYPDVVHLKTSLGVPVLHYAFWKDYQLIMLVLLAHGANINAPDGEGATILHWAAYFGMEEMMAFLLIKGKKFDLDLDAERRGDKQTAVQIAITRKQYDIAKQLITAGADLNLKDKHGITPLCIACSLKNLPLCALLVKSGASPLLYTNDHRTAHDFCPESDKNGAIAKYIALVRDFYGVISCGRSFSTFAATYLTNKDHGPAISSLLHLDKKRIFIKKFERWCKEEKREIYQPAQKKLGGLMRKKKLLPQKTFLEKLSSFISICKI